MAILANDERSGSMSVATHLSQVRPSHVLVSSKLKYLLHRPHTQARHSEKSLSAGSVDIDGEKFSVLGRPSCLRVQVQAKARSSDGSQFGSLKTVESQQPISLIKPVLSNEGWGLGRQAPVAVLDRTVGRVVDASQSVTLVES